MIPTIIPPLTALSVLVTRPAAQAAALAAKVVELGGEAIIFPAIAIEPLTVAEPQVHELVIFISVHAVEHGARLIRKTNTMRIAAIGKATAAALAAANLPPDIVPATTETSEGLLAHPELQSIANQKVLIVRGEGGRETLREAFVSRGCVVSTLEVYRRTKAVVSESDVQALEQRWLEGNVDVVTATSVETYLRLEEILSERGRAALRTTALLAPSRRVIEAAESAGWRGAALVSGGADDASILGTLARWQARARIDHDR